MRFGKRERGKRDVFLCNSSGCVALIFGFSYLSGFNLAEY